MFRYLSPLVIAVFINPTTLIAQDAVHEFAGSYECVNEVNTGVRFVDGKFEIFEPEWKRDYYVLVSPDGAEQNVILGDPVGKYFSVYKINISSDRKEWVECLPISQYQRRLSNEHGKTACTVEMGRTHNFHFQFKDGFFIRTTDALISEYGNVVTAGRCKRL